MLRPPPWVLAALVMASPAIAQRPPTSPPTLHIASPPNCSQCRLTLTTTLRLGADTGVAFHDLGYTAARDGKGRLFFTGFGEKGAIAVYDPRSQRITTLGRRGRGPGEFISPTFVLAGPGDSIYVWDEPVRRLTVFSPELRVARTLEVRDFRALRGLVLETGEVILAGHSTSPAGIGFPLLRLNPKTGSGTPIGGDGGMVRPERSLDQMLELGRSRGGRLWAGRVNRYQLTLRDRDGRALRRIERSAAWFPSREGRDPRTEVPWSAAALVGVWEDGGLLWTASVVPVTRMAAAAAPVRHARTEASDRITHEFLVERLDTVLEAIDPVRGELLLSQRVSGPLVPGAEPGTLLRLSIDDEGREFLELLKVQMHRAGR